MLDKIIQKFLFAVVSIRQQTSGVIIWLLQAGNLVDLMDVLHEMLDDFQALDRCVKLLDKGVDLHGICTEKKNRQ